MPTLQNFRGSRGQVLATTLGFALLAAVIAVALMGCAAPAGAQYFGRNKVQYERFKFEVLRTPHFDIHYYAAEKPAAEDAARMLER